MLRGFGRNGKTKLMETVERLINKSAIYSDRVANVKTDKFAVGSLAGKLLLIDDDVDTGTKLPDGFLKKLSERKLMTGQSKFKDSFEFIYTALPVMFKHIRQEGEITRRLSQIIEIGNYKFDLSCDANVNCIKLENPSTYSHSEPRSSSDDSGINPFVWICAAGLILWVIFS